MSDTVTFLKQWAEAHRDIAHVDKAHAEISEGLFAAAAEVERLIKDRDGWQRIALDGTRAIAQLSQRLREHEEHLSATVSVPTLHEP